MKNCQHNKLWTKTGDLPNECVPFLKGNVIDNFCKNVNYLLVLTLPKSKHSSSSCRRQNHLPTSDTEKLTFCKIFYAGTATL